MHSYWRRRAHSEETSGRLKMPYWTYTAEGTLVSNFVFKFRHPMIVWGWLATVGRHDSTLEGARPFLEGALRFQRGPLPRTRS